MRKKKFLVVIDVRGFTAVTAASQGARHSVRKRITKEGMLVISDGVVGTEAEMQMMGG